MFVRLWSDSILTYYSETSNSRSTAPSCTSRADDEFSRLYTELAAIRRVSGEYSQQSSITGDGSDEENGSNEDGNEDNEEDGGSEEDEDNDNDDIPGEQGDENGEDNNENNGGREREEGNNNDDNPGEQRDNNDENDPLVETAQLVVESISKGLPFALKFHELDLENDFHSWLLGLDKQDASSGKLGDIIWDNTKKKFKELEQLTKILKYFAGCTWSLSCNRGIGKSRRYHPSRQGPLGIRITNKVCYKIGRIGLLTFAAVAGTLHCEYRLNYS